MTSGELAVKGPGTGAPGARGVERAAVEVPTLLLLLANYGGWLAITYAYGRWPLIAVLPIAIVLVALHSSLQHEVVHGHPTRWKTVNRAFGMIPLSLWMPFERYRFTHRIHHRDVQLTDPLDDPESFYLTPEEWAQANPLARASLQLQQTLAGRVLVGSFWSIGRFLRLEWALVRSNRNGERAMWLEHLLWCVPVLAWVKLVCGMPLWLYIVAIVIPANGVVLIRSFAEHRAHPQMRERIAIVEDSWILGPLFLFNNLHSLHHETPLIPWYELPRRYRQARARLIAENGGLVYRSYFEVARRFLFRAHDTVAHPTGRAPVAKA